MADPPSWVRLERTSLTLRASKTFSAHLRAAVRAPKIGFARYIVLAATPFERHHLAMLTRAARAGMASGIRFRPVLRSLREGQDFRSSLAREVGAKFYHDTQFGDGPYPVAK